MQNSTVCFNVDEIKNEFNYEKASKMNQIEWDFTFLKEFITNTYADEHDRIHFELRF